MEYKIHLQEQREKKALLSAKSDFSLLEKLIQAVNKYKWCMDYRNGVTALESKLQKASN